MTVKEKKRILKQINVLDERIEQLRRERERSRLCDTYHSPLGSDLTGGISAGTVVEVAVEKRAEDYNTLINAELDKMYRLRLAIEHALNTMSNGTEQRVLRLYYLGLIDNFGERRTLTLFDISKIMNYSERQIQRIHKAALLHLPDIELENQ